MNNGFTLIEVMVTLTLVMIMAAAGLVYYQVPMSTIHQASAKLDLITLASAMESYYERHNTYQGVSLFKLQFQAQAKGYVIGIITANNTSFKIAAIPVDSRDECGTFYLDEEGNQSVSGVGKNCW